MFHNVDQFLSKSHRDVILDSFYGKTQPESIRDVILDSY